MTIKTSNIRELTPQVLALSVADRLHLMEEIVRSLQADIAPDRELNGTIDGGQNSSEVAESDAEDTKNLDEHGNRHPLLVMLESLEPLDDEEEFPDVDEGSLPLDDVCL